MVRAVSRCGNWYSSVTVFEICRFPAGSAFVSAVR